MKTSILRNGERYFGVDIEPDGSLTLMSALTPVRGIEVTSSGLWWQASP